MNDSLPHQEYISYTLHHPQQTMGYTTLNGASVQQLSGHQQQYGVMHSHSDLLQQAASGLLATEAPDGPLMMGSASGGVLLTLNGATSAMHNGSTVLNQQAQQYGAISSSGSPLSTVLVSTNNVSGATVLGSPQPSSQSGQNSQRSASSGNNLNSNSSNTNSPPVHSSKKKRKCYSIDLFFDVQTKLVTTVHGEVRGE